MNTNNYLKLLYVGEGKFPSKILLHDDLKVKYIGERSICFNFFYALGN